MTLAASDYTAGGVRRTCLLDEGAITVSSGYGLGGGSQPQRTFAAEITRGMVVAVSTDTGNTWDNTKAAGAEGAILVNRIADNTDIVWGVVISEPSAMDMECKPANTAAADTLAKRLSGKFLRKATVWFPNVVSMTKATLTCANAAAVTPGGVKLLKIDVSACNADGGIFVNDIGSSGGSANICSMHYQAQSSTAVVPIMIAMLGGTTSAAT